MTRGFWGTFSTLGAALALTGCFTLNVIDDHRDAAVIGRLEYTAKSLALPQPTVHIRVIHYGGDVDEKDITLNPPVPMECGNVQLAIVQPYDYNIRRLNLERPDSASVGNMNVTPDDLKRAMSGPRPDLEERCAVIMTAQRVNGRVLIQAVAHGQVFAEIEESEEPRLGAPFILKSVAALGADIVTLPFQMLLMPPLLLLLRHICA